VADLGTGAFSQCSDLPLTERRADGIGLAKGSDFIGRQTVEHWNWPLVHTAKHCCHPSQRSKEQATIGLRWLVIIFCVLYFPFNANIGTAEAVAGDSDDSDVVAGDASYVSSSSLLLLLSAVRHSASVWTHMEWLTAARNYMRL